MTARALLHVVSIAALAAAACTGGRETPADETVQSGGTAAATAGAAGPTGDATVNGTVHFAGTLPANPAIDMSEEAVCKAKHPGAVSDSQYVGTGGGLGNVFVHVTSGLPAGARYAPPTAPVVIDQEGCLYHPRVFGVQVGQPIEIRNSDAVLHNIKAVPKQNRGFNISQPSAGMKTTRTFTTAEVAVPLECNVHGWMNAAVGVVAHPFFATSTPDGRFTIRNLPPGTYTIEAWHEKLGTQTATVTVGAGETKTADFHFGPRA